jgi:uncharacterized protein (TIGR02246 family)
MGDDEKKIRELIDDWARATMAHEVGRLRTLMADDAVFLVPGRPPLRGWDEFVSMSRDTFQHARIEVTSDIQEIKVAGDLAYCWNNLTVTVTPRKRDQTVRRAGPVLTIFRKKDDGNWVLSRDANLLTEAPKDDEE